MTHLRTFLPVALAVLTHAPSVLAQERESLGPFRGMPHGLSVVRNTMQQDPLRDGVVYHRGSGNPINDPPPPTSPSCNGGPDFSLLQTQGLIRPGVRIDALSIGFDNIAANTIGEYEPPSSPGWAALTFTVNPGALGPGGDHPISLEYSANDGVGGDLFSYQFPNTILAGGVADTVFRAQDSTEMGVFETSPLLGRNMDAHDAFSGMCVTGTFEPLPEEVTLYFSVDHDWVLQGGTAVDHFFNSNSLPPHSRDGRTIFATTWRNGGWEEVDVWLDPDHLGIEVGKDLDALAYDASAAMLLFSDDDDETDPILFFHLSSGTQQVYRLPGAQGEAVSAKIGLSLAAHDDIEGLCALDPGSRFQSPPPLDVGGKYGPGLSQIHWVEIDALLATPLPNGYGPYSSELLINATAGTENGSPVVFMNAATHSLVSYPNQAYTMTFVVTVPGAGTVTTYSVPHVGRDAVQASMPVPAQLANVSFDIYAIKSDRRGNRVSTSHMLRMRM